MIYTVALTGLRRKGRSVVEVRYIAPFLARPVTFYRAGIFLELFRVTWVGKPGTWNEFQATAEYVRLERMDPLPETRRKFDPARIP